MADPCQRDLRHLSYAIGISKPLFLFTETHGMEQGGLTFSDVVNFVKDNFDRRPGALHCPVARPTGVQASRDRRTRSLWARVVHEDRHEVFRLAVTPVTRKASRLANAQLR